MTLCFVGMMLAPPVFGSVVDRLGWTAAWITLAVIGIIGILILLPIRENKQKQ